MNSSKSFRDDLIVLAPFCLALTGLILILVANSVVGFNAGTYSLPLNSNMTKEVGSDLKVLWQKVDQAIADTTNIPRANLLSPIREKYYERKVQIGVAAVITTMSLLILWLLAHEVFRDNTKDLAPRDKRFVYGGCWGIVLLFGLLLWFRNVLTQDGPVRHLTELIKKLGDGTIISVIGQGVAAVAGVSVCWLVFACCSLLRKRREINEKRGIERQIYQAKLLLGISSVSLASGVVINYLFHSWSAPLMEFPERTIGLTNLLTINVGILFTFLLLLLFTPVALIHQHRLSQVSHDVNPSVSWSLVVREFLTCAIPIAVAALAQWLGADG